MDSLEDFASFVAKKDTVFLGGHIFEPGFPDVLMQMWAAFFADREGELGDHFGCVTPEEAFRSHQLFQAALDSQRLNQTISL